MWVLLLNDMRSSNIEILAPVARADTKEELIAFLAKERVPGYRDGNWGKSYRAGGPLEWFNQPWDFNDYQHFQDVGSEADWMENARRRYQETVLSLPMAVSA